MCRHLNASPYELHELASPASRENFVVESGMILPRFGEFMPMGNFNSKSRLSYGGGGGMPMRPCMKVNSPEQSLSGKGTVVRFLFIKRKLSVIVSDISLFSFGMFLIHRSSPSFVSVLKNIPKLSDLSSSVCIYV